MFGTLGGAIWKVAPWPVSITAFFGAIYFASLYHVFSQLLKFWNNGNGKYIFKKPTVGDSE